MNLKFLILLLLTPMIVLAAPGGGGTDMGNGGDLVKCAPYQGNALFGLYSLDYLVQAREKAQMPNEVKSWQESLFNIRRTMVDKIPELLPFFDEYMNDILNEDQSRRHVWEATDYQLTEISDEQLPLSVQIPVNCRENGKLQIVQAVIRQNPTFTGSKLIVYKYMPKIFEKMAQEKPLQLSFLLVHEFLWSISDNVDRNRRINWFLHSTEFQTLPRLEVINRLLGMGLNIKEIPRILDANGGGHFTTLQDALSKVRANETLIVKEGVYSTGGAGIITPIKLIGQGDRKKIILKGTKTFPALDINLEKDQTIEIQNMTIEREFEDSRDDRQFLSGGIILTSGKLVLRNSYLHASTTHVILATGQSELDMEGSTMEWDDRGLGFYEFRGKVRVHNNNFHRELYHLQYTSATVYVYYSLNFESSFTNNIFGGISSIINVRYVGDDSVEDAKLDDEFDKHFINNKCPDIEDYNKTAAAKGEKLVSSSACAIQN